jgi:hypothetical protein
MILAARPNGKAAGWGLGTDSLQSATGMVHFFALAGRRFCCIFAGISMKLNGLY